MFLTIHVPDLSTNNESMFTQLSTYIGFVKPCTFKHSEFYIFRRMTRILHIHIKFEYESFMTAMPRFSIILYNLMKCDPLLPKFSQWILCFLMFRTITVFAAYIFRKKLNSWEKLYSFLLAQFLFSTFSDSSSLACFLFFLQFFVYPS